MASGPLDILAKLRPLSWRKIVVPCQANGLSFTHGHVHHEGFGVDGAPVEPTGRKNAKYSFRIPFRTGCGDYPNLYPTRFRDFWNACVDGSVGELVHPEFGPMDALVESYAMSVDPNLRDGYDVDVVWTETTENERGLADASRSTIYGAITLASDLEKLSGYVNPPVKYNDGSGMSLTSAMKKLQGIVQQAQFSVDNAMAQINGILAGLNSMIDTCNSITDPNAWGLSRGLKQLTALMVEGQDKLNNSKAKRRIQFIIAQAQIEVSQAANGASMALDEFLKLNPRLALTKTIAKNREYFIYV